MKTGSLSPIVLLARRDATYESTDSRAPLKGYEGAEMEIEQGEPPSYRRSGIGNSATRDGWTVVDQGGRSCSQNLRDTIARLLEHKITQSSVLFLLVVMGVSMGIQASVPLTGNLAAFLTNLDNALVIIFLVEILLRLYAMGLSFFGDGWNWFDLIVIILSVLPMVLLLFDGTEESYDMAVFRVLRVFRLLRVLRSSRNLRLIVESLGASLPNIGWILFFLLVMFYIFGLIGTHIFGEVFKDWFGNLGRSMYTLFQVMTLESWSMGISRPVMEVYPWAWVFFIPFILIATYTTMNIFIAVIVTTMQNAHAKMLSEEIELKLQHKHDTAQEHHEATLAEISQLRGELASMRSSFGKYTKKITRRLSKPRLDVGNGFDGNSAAIPVPIPGRERKAIHPCVSSPNIIHPTHDL